MAMDFSYGKSTLVQVMAWCRQATSHYLSQCWPWSLSSYGVIRQQLVKWYEHTVNPNLFFSHWSESISNCKSSPIFLWCWLIWNAWNIWFLWLQINNTKSVINSSKIITQIDLLGFATINFETLTENLSFTSGNVKLNNQYK